MARADDWPHWRGPERNGISRESGLLTAWPGGEPRIAWKARVGLGFSSCVVGGGRAFTAGHANDQDTIWAFDAATGRELWKHSYPADLGDKYFEGGTTGTPTLAGDRLYWLGRWGDLFCFEAGTGKIVWSKNIQRETGAAIPDWGFTGAPLVEGDLLILNVGEAGVALNKSTGVVAWKSGNKSAAYSTPLPFEHAGRRLILLANTSAYVAVHPADGREAWRTRWVTEYGVNASDPIVQDGRMFLSTGYGKGSALLPLGGGEEAVWKSKKLRTQMNAAVLFEGHLYGVDGDTTERASLKCLDFATGAEKWTQPGFGSGGLIIAGDQIIALSSNGELLIAPATPAGFKPVARGQVLGGKSWTAPVLAHGLIYCRNSRGDVAVVDVRKP